MKHLEDYNKKRNFNKSPEPEGFDASPEEKNRFVVQWHHARREHYDFRLQMEDVLISWAIPKKPVSDPDVKRLAIKVEDHPISYIHFEGNIPKGNYGAGTVMVWDIGYYYLGAKKKFPTTDELKKHLSKGSLKLYLQGVKLKGFYNLVRASNQEKNEWIFMKAPDKDEKTDQEQRSVLTGRSIDEIADSDTFWNSEKQNSDKINKDKQPQKTTENTIQNDKKAFPGFIKPMLATLTDKAFSDENWIYELKYDGYRIIACNNGAKTILYSRNGNDFTDRYPFIVELLSEINAKFVLDGEMCYMEDAQTMNFQKLQNKEHDPNKINYFVFDLLWLNGHNLTELPQTERKKLLSVLLKNTNSQIHYVEHIEKEGESFFAEIDKKQLEGIIAKRASGKYIPGARSDDWLKIKTGIRQEMIICGYQPSENNARAFASLLCCVNENNNLIYTGRVGTGFNEKFQKDLLKKLEKLITSNVPVENPPKANNVIWVKPELICEVKFSSWTKEKIMRHPSFAGMRTDKKTEEIKIEKPVSSETKETKVRFSNLNKIFWPELQVTKGDVIDYYRDISEFILPYLKDRPQSLYRTPNGMEGKGFFQKNMQNLAPEWTQTIRIDNSKKGYIEYLLCQDIDTLLFMANLGCIEINPWSSSLPELDNPDFMIFDLDPVEIEFEKVLLIARSFKDLFDQLSIPAFCKTSGSRGLHIYVPVQKKYSYPQVQNFVKIIEQFIHKKHNDLTSFERSPSKRKGKIYLDYLQNAKGKTMSSVYSLRPRPGAPASAPVHWDEVKKGLTPDKFNIRNIRKRLEKEGDLWKEFFDQRIDIGKITEQISK